MPTLADDTDTLTVRRGTTGTFTVRPGTTRHFTVIGRIGRIITNAILREDGSALLTEAGDLILF